ncbi:MAG: hypothetical protein MJ126_05540 [Lachnospiraceae bacterium]|nr:hypothetical protein [Lachnospiraceae bacterium]
MSGGSLDYLAFRMNDALFDEANVHYSNVGNPKENMYARSDNPFEDKDISELIFDVACVIHALEWYKSGDISEETYREILAKFKKSYILDETIDFRVHKKALELACEDIAWIDVPRTNDTQYYIDLYLKKARKE